MMMRQLRVGFVIAAVLATTVSVLASDPVGVYCRIEKVVLEPNATTPSAIQIWGAFSFAQPIYAAANPPGTFGNASVGDLYGPVQAGYLYYTCPKGQESVCRAEWNDLKTAADKHEVVGIGGRHSANGRVRKADEKAASPDPYILNVGVVSIGAYRATSTAARDLTNRTQYPDLIAALEAALKSK
jgi:hypothetical protein